MILKEVLLNFRKDILLDTLEYRLTVKSFFLWASASYIVVGESCQLSKGQRIAPLCCSVCLKMQGNLLLTLFATFCGQVFSTPFVVQSLSSNYGIVLGGYG